MEFKLAIYDELDSTNLEVKRAIDRGEPEGFAARAARQTGGYGRQGRSWASPAGGLYLSVLLRPQLDPTQAPDQLPTLSLLAAVAVRRALVQLVDPAAASRLALKWPNDILVTPCVECDLASDSVSDSALACASAPNLASASTPVSAPASPSAPLLKLCGISLEAYRGALCLGVGVNVHAPQALMEVTGKNAPTFAAELGFEGSIDQLASTVLEAFASTYEQWLVEGLVPFVAEFNAHAAFVGARVGVRDLLDAVQCAGIVHGIDEKGRLLIEQDGRVLPVSSGEVHLVAF